MLRPNVSLISLGTEEDPPALLWSLGTDRFEREDSVIRS
jgi:hypothetical protein